MKKALLIIIALGFVARLTAQIPPITVPDLSPETLDTIPENEFFLLYRDTGKREKDHAAMRLCLKFTGNFDSLRANISSFHKTEPVRGSNKGLDEYVWPEMYFPLWFYTTYNIHLEFEPKEGYHLLRFWDGMITRKNQKMVEVNGLPGLFGMLMVAEYGNFVRTLTTPVMLASAFDYGRSDSAFFISLAEFHGQNINEIIQLQQLPEGVRGKFGQNWDWEIATFGENEIVKEYAPLLLPAVPIPDVDSLRNVAVARSRWVIELADGKITGEGGAGYDSYTWRDFYRYGDSVVFTKLTCRGNCGIRPFDFFKTVFDSTGRPQIFVNYPDPAEMKDATFERYADWDRYVHSGISEGEIPDTTFFHYTKNGRYAGWYDGYYDQDHGFSLGELSPLRWIAYPFSQVYFNGEPLESWMRGYCGVSPERILLEIAPNYMYSFTRNPNTGKYQWTATKSLLH